MEDINRITIYQSSQNQTSFQTNQLLKQGGQRDEQEQNELRLKMQTMHDKLKGQTKIGRSLNGDHGNDPPSFKSIEDFEFINQLGQSEHQPKNRFQLGKQSINAKEMNSNSDFDDISIQKGIFQQKQEDDEKQQLGQDLKLAFSEDSPQNMLSYDFNRNDLVVSPQSEKLQQSLNKYNESSEDSSKYKTHQNIEMNNFSMLSGKNLMRQDNGNDIAFYMLGIYEDSNNFQVSWLQKYGITNLEYYDRYIYSIYWAVTTMTTVFEVLSINQKVGYGDITATNSSEALFISIALIVFSCVYAYSINNIGFILQEIERSSKKLNENISIIQRKNVDIQLKTRVRFYLSFLEQESKNRDKQAEDKIIGTLSNQLREEITQQINSKILQDQNIFKNNFSHKINKSIVFIMEEVLVTPNEIIFQENDTNDQSIYFIQNGIVEIYSDCYRQDKETSCKVYQTITQNQFFGEISFFSGLARSASARSVNLTTLYRIKRDRFIDLVKTSEYDFERFKMIQEKIAIHGNLSCLYLKCYSCKKIGHLASNCPVTHPFFDKQFIFLKNNFSEIQERQPNYLRAEKTKQLKPIIQAKKNIQICKKLKDLCRNLNSRTQFLYNITSDEDEGLTFDTDSLLSQDAQSSKFGQEIKSFAKQTTDLSQKIENKQIQKLIKSNQDEISIIEKQIGLIKQNSALNDQVSNNCANNYDLQQINNNFNISPDTQYFSKVEQIVSVLKKQNQLYNSLANENAKENNQKQGQFIKSRSDFKNYLNSKQVNFNKQNTQNSNQDPKNQIFFQKKISKELLDDQDVFFLSPQIIKVQSNIQQNNKKEQPSLSATSFKIFEQQIQQQEKGEENPSKNQLNRIKSSEYKGNRSLTKLSSSKQTNLQFKNQTNQLTQEFASEKMRNSQKTSNNLIRSHDYSQYSKFYSQQDFFEQIQMYDFERVKIYKKFFPHNNIDRVITTLKKIQTQQKKERFKKNLERRRQIIFALDHIQNRLICETPSKNNVRQKKKELTSLSYGVTLKQKEQLKQVV